MSIVVSKVAEPYAEALLDLATSNDTLKETTNDMNIVSQFLANSSDLKKFLSNPRTTSASVLSPFILLPPQPKPFRWC